VLGAKLVAGKLTVSSRTVQRWISGVNRPEALEPAVKAIMAVAEDSGLLFSSDDGRSPEEICAVLPARVAATHWFVAVMMAGIVQQTGSLSAAARASKIDTETARDWCLVGFKTREFIFASLSNDALDEMKSIDKINAIIAKLCRHKDIRAAHRRIGDGLLKPGDDPSVDRQAIIAGLMRRFEPDKKRSTRLMSPEETLVLPVAVAREWMKVKTEKGNHKLCVGLANWNE
jgi:hypothetical protein